MAIPPLETVLAYHQATKHHFGRYARSLGFMDWSTQPAPFRRFAGVETVALDLPEGQKPVDWDALFTGATEPEPFNRQTLSRFFYFSLALSAWKQVTSPTGEVLSRWALRVNPSSGNLHPTEAYAVLGPDQGFGPGSAVYHYAPDEHLLERRVSLAEPLGPAGGAGFFVGLASIHWREAWKYGERAFRYCQHDVGHALGALALSAACLGWDFQVVPEVDPQQLGALLGCSDQTGPEAEQPDLLCLVTPANQRVAFRGSSLLLAEPEVQGQPRPLSPSHQDWPIISEVAEATNLAVASGQAWVGPDPAPSGPDRRLDAHRLIRQRRSAVSMDASTHLEAESFFALLRRLLPRQRVPFASLGHEPLVSLVLFVHRVKGLDPGLYFLSRHDDHETSLRGLVRQEFSWKKPDSVPADLALYQWASGDMTRPARQLSCNQAIAGDGAFSLGMLARFRPALDEHGPGFYRQLFWETGMIGQMLYLEAEAAGIRGTGIGCYFDDEFHTLLGLEDQTWQSLYHFTVGGPQRDDRLQTFPAYHHLDR